MSFTNALEDLHEDLILLGQPENRRDKVANELCDAIKACLEVFPDYRSTTRRLVYLYASEVLAAQRFLTQFALHLKLMPSGHECDPHKEELPFGVFHNWK